MLDAPGTRGEVWYHGQHRDRERTAVAERPYLARIVRGETLRVRHATFIEAARGMGASTPNLLRRHVLPNVLGPV
ncbi:MAG: ABC transporter permease subunit, partial [Miltoncostaeaceae bacterium]